MNVLDQHCFSQRYTRCIVNLIVCFTLKLMFIFCILLLFERTYKISICVNQTNKNSFCNLDIPCIQFIICIEFSLLTMQSVFFRPQNLVLASLFYKLDLSILSVSLFLPSQYKSYIISNQYCRFYFYSKGIYVIQLYFDFILINKQFH